MRAVGTSFHLKHRFGVGYHIEIIAAKGESDNVKAKIAKLLPGILYFQSLHLISF